MNNYKELKLQKEEDKQKKRKIKLFELFDKMSSTELRDIIFGYS